MDDIAEYALMILGVIAVAIGLFFLYFAICIGLGLLIEAILGWMGKEVADWYWTGVALVALLGAFATSARSSD